MKIKIAVFLTIFVNGFMCAQWVTQGGPKGGGALYHAELNDILFRASNFSVYASYDNGENWVLRNNGLPCNEVLYDLKSYQGKLYISVTRNGIYVSDNSGESWKPLNNAIGSETFYKLSFHETSIYASHANGGFYRSGDLGATWDYSTISGFVQNSFEDFIVHDSKLYVIITSIDPGDKNDLYASDDNGDTWVRMNLPDLQWRGLYEFIEFNGSYFISSQGRIYRSDDGMESWTYVSIGDINRSITSFDIEGSTLYANMSLGTYHYSLDNGVSWTAVQNTKTENLSHFIQLIDGKLHMGTDEGVYVSSNNGVSWDLIEVNGIDLQIHSIKEINNTLYSITSLGVFKSQNNGQSWENITNGLSLTNYEITGKDDTLILANINGVYVSKDEGATWNKKLDAPLDLKPTLLDSDGAIAVTTLSIEGVHVSTNNGETWTFASNIDFPEDTGLSAIIVKGNSILLATDNMEVFLSEDLGDTWKNVSFNQPKLVSTFKLIDGVVYASTFQGLMYSDDFGKSWNSFDPAYNFATYDIDIVGEQMYVGTNQGVYVVNMNDGIYYQYCEGLGLEVVTNIHISAGLVFAGTWNKSIWKRMLSETIPPSEDHSTLGIETINLCPGDGKINLFSTFGYAQTNSGTWSPGLSGENGDFDPTIDAGGKYIFRFDNEKCGCEDYLKFEVIVDNANAGEDAELTFCTSEESFDLTSRIPGNPDSSGIWSPLLKSGSNIFDPAVDQAGIYTYTVSNDGCGTDISTISINLTAEPNAGEENSIEICQNSSSINLFEKIKGTPDSGGAWSPALLSGGNIFDPSKELGGVYTYTVGSGICQVSTTINVTINEIPSAGENGIVSVCTNSAAINLIEYLNGNPTNGGTWSPQLLSGTDSFNPELDPPGRYEYTVSTDCGMKSAFVDVEVYEAYNYENAKIISTEFLGQNEIKIEVEPGLSFEYSLNNENFQQDNVFRNIPGGVYTVFGREIDGCGIFQKEISIIDYPRFFTPNNDGINDSWNLLGAEEMSNYEIFIFNRFGKIVAVLNEKSSGWDGTYNGELLPSTDYWFKADFGDNGLLQGHFSLIR